MELDIGVVEIVRWITYIFPAFTEYTKIVTPIVIFTLSVSGVFFNILPKPGQIYHVPCLLDLKVEMKYLGRVVYILTRISRWVTIKINTFICSKMYLWLYRLLSKFYALINRWRGNTPSPEEIKITPPEHFKFDLNHLTEEDHNE